MKYPKHDLHNKILMLISGLVPPGLLVLYDKDCVPKNNSQGNLILRKLPFYLSVNAQRDTCVSNVDLMIIKNNKIKLVCEIEESGYNPTKIYGKVFSTASAIMSKVDSGTKYDLDKNGVFLQIISSNKLSKYSKKKFQGKNIEVAINDIFKKAGLWIKEYHLIYGDENYFQADGKGYDKIKNILKKF
jgi:hypothetical protein